MKRTIVLIATLLVLSAVIGGFGYFQFVLKPEMIRGAISGAARPPVTVSAEPARTESWTPILPAIGTFKAVQGVDIAPQVGGVIRRIEFESGQTVETGDLLVELDSSVEQADLKSNIAQLKKTQLNLDRQRELLARGTTTKASFDSALADRDTVAASVDRTEAVIAQKTITAPFAGLLGLRLVDLGQYVSPGMQLVTLQQLDPIFVDFPVPEQDFDLLRTGLAVDVTVDAYPGEAFKGTIDSVDARVNQNTRTVLVRAKLDNRDHRLLPGMFANVQVLAGAPEKVVTVPRTAISYSLYGDSVYVVTQAAGEGGAAANKGGDLVVERRFVRVGETRDGLVSVLEGVSEGERVVTTGQIKLEPGAHVVVDESAGLTPPAQRPRE